MPGGSGVGYGKVYGWGGTYVWCSKSSWQRIIMLNFCATVSASCRRPPFLFVAIVSVAASGVARGQVKGVAALVVACRGIFDVAFFWCFAFVAWVGKVKAMGPAVLPVLVVLGLFVFFVELGLGGGECFGKDNCIRDGGASGVGLDFGGLVPGVAAGGVAKAFFIGVVEVRVEVVNVACVFSALAPIGNGGCEEARSFKDVNGCANSCLVRDGVMAESVGLSVGELVPKVLDWSVAVPRSTHGFKVGFEVIGGDNAKGII